MKLQQLRFVLAIADCGLNITHASQVLYTSQPGVSKQLRLLEEELGVEIFSRNGKALVAITSEGKVVLDKAREIMQTVNDIKTFSNQNSNEQRALPYQRYSSCA